MLVAANRAPDLICLGDVWLGPIAPLLLDLGPFLERDNAALGLDDFPAPLLEACKWDGVTRCLPRSFHVQLLYYNKAIFDAAGEPYPHGGWTLDDYRAAALRLTRPERPGEPGVWGTGLTTGWWGEWLALVRAFGGDLLDPAHRTCRLREPAARDALAFYRATHLPPAVAPGPGRAPEGDFASGRIAMDYGGHTSLWQVYRRVEGLDWDIAPLPAGPSGQTGAELAIDAVAITARCRNPDAAWDLMKRLLDPAVLEKAVALGAMPVRLSVARATLLAPGRTEAPRNTRALFDALASAKTAPHTAAFSELAIDVIQPEIDRMLAGRATVEEASARAADGAEALLRALREHGGEKR
jgi:multiple sugar transport system substrate-binding protein